MGLSWSWRMLGENLLTRVRRVSTASPIVSATDVSVGVTDVVSIFFVESIVGDELERLPPENETILERQADTLQEQCILQTAEVF